MAFKAGSLRAAIENSGSILWSILAVIATFVVKDHLRDNCSPSSRYCKINLGSAGVISLPAIVAFRTKHKTFLSLNAAEGGEATMSEKGAGPSEMWEIMQTADDKWNVTIRSVYGTYLSCSQDRETVAMVGQPFEDEASQSLPQTARPLPLFRSLHRWGTLPFPLRPMGSLGHTCV